MSAETQTLPAYRYDIALEEGVGPWLVTWVSGLMVFFVTLALAANFALSAVAQHWMEGLAGNLTVELRPGAAGAEKIAELAGKHPAVQAARVLEREEIARLIEPWLGHKAPANLPLPVLVDVRLMPEADVERLGRDIAVLVPGAVVDRHEDTLNSVRTLAQTLRLFVLLLTGVIIALAVVSIAGIVRAKFAIHRQEVETLHLIGSSDEYIARQFRRHTLKGVLKGAVTGLFCMVAALLAVGWATGTVDASVFPRLRLLPWQWLALLSAPVLAGTLIAHMTAQRAVMRELAKLP